MVLIADISSADCDFSALSDALTAFGQEKESAGAGAAQ